MKRKEAPENVGMDRVQAEYPECFVELHHGEDYYRVYNIWGELIAQIPLAAGDIVSAA